MPAQAGGAGDGDRAGGGSWMILLVDNYDSFTYNLAHLFGELGVEVVVRRNHSLAAARVPGCLEVSAICADGEVMAVRHRELPVDGVQFHPESVLTPLGPALARNFLEGREC